MGPGHFSTGQVSGSGGGGSGQMITVQAQIPSGTGTQTGPAMVLPSAHRMGTTGGIGPGHLSALQVGNTEPSGGGLHLHVGQPLASLTSPYGHPIAHTGPH